MRDYHLQPVLPSGVPEIDKRRAAEAARRHRTFMNVWG
jgi:hypothetical protein